MAEGRVECYNKVKKGKNMAKKDAVDNKKSNTGAEKADSGKSEALKLAMAQITKQFGDGAIMKLGETPKMDVELLPSGSLSLDLALGGGWPKGRNSGMPSCSWNWARGCFEKNATQKPKSG